nr:hypothetical protein [Tanacetum cinerariifolium]
MAVVENIAMEDFLDSRNFGSRLVVGVDDTQVVVDKLAWVAFAFQTEYTITRKNLSFVNLGSELMLVRYFFKGFLLLVISYLVFFLHIEDKAYARELEVELNANICWNEVIEQVKRKEKQNNTVMRYQALKRKPITKAQARKNTMVYLKNMVGFKMDFFKGMTYTDIRPIFEKHFNSIVAFLEKGEKEIEEEASKVIKRKSEVLRKKQLRSKGLMKK